MLRRRLRIELAPLILLGLSACTKADLYGQVGQVPPLADRVTLTGILCTDNPATRQFPVKILFIVDSSGTMREAAPEGEHVLAIEQTISQVLPIQNVSVGVISYGNNAIQLTSEPIGRTNTVFTRDAAKVDSALVQLRNGAGARDFASGISLSKSVVEGDILQADRGPLSRTKYILVHVVSGSPAPSVPQSRCDDFATPPLVCELGFFEEEIRALRDFALNKGAADLSFHTIFLEPSSADGLSCDPTLGSAMCPVGTACVQAGKLPITGRCVDSCVTNADCTLDPLRPVCAQVDLPQGQRRICARGELSCFDGLDNDGDGKGLDCSDLDNYPYGCAGGGSGCEDDCLSACRTEKLGLSMSLNAGGVYNRFRFADELNFSNIDFRSTQRIFVVKEFLAYNRNASPTESGFLPDTDGDGLTDIEEDELGTNAISGDTDGDSYNDRLEHLLRSLGLDPLTAGVQPDCTDPTLDTDGDGLRDCEEKLLGTDRTLFDSDRDGFPDGIEFRSETNALFNDALDDIDADGVPNAQEILTHTDPTGNDAQLRADLAYRYRTLDLGVTDDSRSCYDFRVSNITLVDTRDSGRGPGFNDIDIYFGQVPEGSLESFGLFYAAQIKVQYLPPDVRIPNTPSIDVDQGDFAFFEQ
jgi:hypothetical protein